MRRPTDVLIAPRRLFATLSDNRDGILSAKIPAGATQHCVCSSTRPMMPNKAIRFSANLGLTGLFIGTIV